MTYSCAGLRIVASTASLAFCAVSARGQELMGPDANHPPAEPPSVQAVLDSTKAAYARLRTYEDTVTFRMEVKGSPEMEGYLHGAEAKGTLAFEAPNRIAEVWPTWAVFCDGRTLWVCDFKRRKYIETEAPARLNKLDLRAIEEGGAGMQNHPVTAILSRRQQPAPLLLQPIGALDRLSLCEHAGCPAFRLDGTLEGEGQMPAALVIDQESRLLTGFEADGTRAFRDSIPKLRALLATQPPYDDEHVKLYQKMAQWRPEDIERLAPVFLIEKIIVDGVIPPERFTYVPEPDMERVERFEGENVGAGAP